MCFAVGTVSDKLDDAPAECIGLYDAVVDGIYIVGGNADAEHIVLVDVDGALFLLLLVDGRQLPTESFVHVH